MRTAPKPATTPVDPLILEAKKAVANNKLDEFATKLEEPLAPRGRILNAANLDASCNSWRCENFSTSLRQVRHRRTTAPPRRCCGCSIRRSCSDSLMMAITKQDAADRVLIVLDALQRRAEGAEEFADLATAAVCVVWDTPAQGRTRSSPRRTGSAGVAVPLFRGARQDPLRPQANALAACRVRCRLGGFPGRSHVGGEAICESLDSQSACIFRCAVRSPRSLLRHGERSSTCIHIRLKTSRVTGNLLGPGVFCDGGRDAIGVLPGRLHRQGEGVTDAAHVGSATSTCAANKFAGIFPRVAMPS